jgi:predicted nucleotidyltransferase component of viral defense system
MIKKTDVEERGREWSLRDAIVEKDYVLGWLLWGIGSDAVLRDSWIFKGGTCLKKAYLETFRFSEDLDFTVLPNGPIQAVDVEPRLRSVLQQITEEAGIDFSVEPLRLQESSDGRYCEGRVFYRGPLGARNPSRIKVDLSTHEKVVRPTVLRPIAHPYPDVLPSPAMVRCYLFEELFAEKIRAMGERARPRDLYDIIYLFRRPDFRRYPEVIRAVLAEKCESKGIAVPTHESVLILPQQQELESEWENMLASTRTSLQTKLARTKLPKGGSVQTGTGRSGKYKTMGRWWKSFGVTQPRQQHSTSAKFLVIFFVIFVPW